MMQALVITDWGGPAELRTMPLPHPGPGELTIRTSYSGVSIGTEMWIAAGRRRDYGDPPFINGYQATGTVREVGADINDIQPGDAVAVFCSGAHAPVVKAAHSLTHKLAAHAPLRESALWVQPAVGANALNMAQVQAGDKVLVVGQGLVGLNTARLARLRGAWVVATDLAQERLDLAAGYSADVVVHTAAENYREVLTALAPGGFDVVIESTGLAHLIDEGMAFCGRGGRFVFEGWYPGDIAYDFNGPHAKELKAFYPCFVGPPAVRESVLRLIASGLLDIARTISHQVPWHEAPAAYNQLFTGQRENVVGMVIDWTGAGTVNSG